LEQSKGALKTKERHKIKKLGACVVSLLKWYALLGISGLARQREQAEKGGAR
jgi:hypothetical protein